MVEEFTTTAERLFSAFEDGVPIAPLTVADPALSVDGAYAIQSRLVRLHTRRGRAVVGRKIGLTSKGIQQQLGVDSPDYGVILDAYVYPSGATVSRSDARMILPRIEGELAFILSSPLHGPGVQAPDVRNATRAIMPVFELIDSRIVDWKITLADTIADNASCYGVVTSEECEIAPDIDLTTVPLQITRDDEPVVNGAASAVMGDPAVAVAWLANALARFGEELPAGQLILSGSFTPAVDLTPGTYRAVLSDTLPSVEMTVEP